MNNSSTLKELPFAPTKTQILRMYHYETDHYVLKQVNTILKAYGDSVWRKSITNPQFRELIEILGVPKGYKNFENE